MGKILALIIGLLAVNAAQACSCAYGSLNSDKVRVASHVFVFRLLDARFEQGAEDPSQNSVIGTIHIVANLRGKTTSREIRYSISNCCGSRMEVGKYYVGFQSSDVAQFKVNAGNTLMLWNGYGREIADKLAAVLRGEERLDDAFAYGLEEINLEWPPRPRCPERDRLIR